MAMGPSQADGGLAIYRRVQRNVLPEAPPQHVHSAHCTPSPTVYKNPDSQAIIDREEPWTSPRSGDILPSHSKSH